ncbi:hypothetical protein ACSVC9_00125 [Clostridium sp. LBM24168]
MSKRQIYRIVSFLDFKRLAQMETVYDKGNCYRFVLVTQKEITIMDKIIEEFPELAGMNEHDIIQYKL